MAIAEPAVSGHLLRVPRRHDGADEIAKDVTLDAGGDQRALAIDDAKLSAGGYSNLKEERNAARGPWRVAGIAADA
jgi:hypothetical protein